jgi:hypothetical protein
MKYEWAKTKTPDIPAKAKGQYDISDFGQVTVQ